MKQHYVMPVGVDDFRQVREEYYYVDKTGFIKSLIDGHSKATLITRPRRFGKTLALSMLYYFFTIENAEENRFLFEGTAIEKSGEKYMAFQGSKPTVFISLKDIKQANYSDMMIDFSSLMQEIYYLYDYLLKSDCLNDSEKKYFKSILSCECNDVKLQKSLKNLTTWLNRYHKKPALVLIDEYDAPIQYAFDYGYYDEAITFMRNYLSATLKSNPDLDFAVLTGVLRIAKFDIAIFPEDKSKNGVIMEFKVAEKETDLSQTAKVALSQIDDMEYITEFKNEGIDCVWKYGVSFCGKKCEIVAKV